MNGSNRQTERSRCLAPVGVAVAICLCWTVCCVGAEPLAAGDSFDGPRIRWEPADHDVAYRVEVHDRTADQARSGHCERLGITAAGGGRYILFTHPVPGTRVLPELRPSVWIRSDRPGVQLMARVVLPRCLDPQTGQPLTALISGSVYSQVGRWQQLSIDNPPLLLSRQVRVLRATMGPAVDEREAYVDQVILNLYAGKGGCNILIDDLEILGYVPVPVGPSESPAREGVQVRGASLESPFSPSSQPADAKQRIQLHGSVLTAEGHPLFPRVIEHRGEPLARLKALEFSGVYLSSPPNVTDLDEADRRGLWLVCPPPDVRPGRTVGPEYRPVLCWDLGWGLSRPELAAARQLGTDLRRADLDGDRPILCSPQADLRSYSRYADILLLDRSPLGTSCELSDFAAWLGQRPLLARPGTPIWAVIQTEPDERIVRQLTALAGGRRQTVGVQFEQIRLLAFTAVAAGARGMVFSSRERLDSPEPVQEMRAQMLELLNLELSLVEPWAAAGEPLGTAAANDPQLSVSVLGTERARLLIAIRRAPGSQYVAPAGTGEEVSFVVPGVPESHTAYGLTPAGFRPLKHKRVTGGMRVTVPEFSLIGLVVLTQDPLVINDLARRVAAIASRSAQLSQSLAERRLTLVENVHAAAGRATLTAASTERWLPQARASLEHCKQLFSRDDAEGTYRSAQQALLALRHVQRSQWENAPSGLASPVTNPFRTHFASLPLSWTFAEEVLASPPGPNLLPGGDFENMDDLLRSGWQHLRHHDETLTTSVELSPMEPQQGNLALRLRAESVQPESAPQVIETPPVWIHSAPVPLRQGQIVQIHGWVKVPQPIAGSHDGLLIFDSLGGLPLAARIDATQEWSEFLIYRAADEDGPLVITFALTGLGEAWLDDVTVTTLLPPVHQARPPYGYPGSR